MRRWGPTACPSRPQPLEARSRSCATWATSASSNRSRWRAGSTAASAIAQEPVPPPRSNTLQPGGSPAPGSVVPERANRDDHPSRHASGHRARGRPLLRVDRPGVAGSDAVHAVPGHQRVARALCISPYTVQDHLKSIFDKTGVRSRGELVGQIFLDHYAARLEAPATAPAGLLGRGIKRRRRVRGSDRSGRGRGGLLGRGHRLDRGLEL